MKLRISGLAIGGIALCVATTAMAQSVSTESLLRDMTDLSRLSAPPNPSYDTHQFSSYDRRSTAPNAPGWFENADGFGKEPQPGVLQVLQAAGKDGVGRYLIAEISHPGAIVRTWTARMNGELTVFLDGSAEPLFKGSAEAFLTDRPACFGAGFESKLPGFNQVDANYFPLPFAKGLRIEWTGKIEDLHFYHIGVRRYVPGTEVKSFENKDLEPARELILDTSKALDAPDAWHAAHIAGERKELSMDVAPGQKTLLLQKESAGTVVELGLKLAANNLSKALRQNVLQAFFDGSAVPQIEAPVGDFFGSWLGITPYDSLPMTVRPDGTMICRFAMPFAHNATFLIKNLSNEAASITGWIVLGKPTTQPAPMHLIARWRVNHGLEAGGGELSQDLPFLMAHGQGNYVGTTAHIMNPTPVISIGGSWWGEGDEKVWVDKTDFPQYFGTGSEDYFNYSWSRIDLFAHAYCAQPVATGPGCNGYTTNIRWHILDSIPFQEQMAFFMELMHHSPTPGLSYARTAYYYATPQTRDDSTRLKPEDVLRGMDCPVITAPVISGAKDALFFQAEDLKYSASSGKVTVAEDGLALGGKLVQWQPDKVGDTLEFTLDAPKDGRYELGITRYLSPEGGRFIVSVDNGKTVGEEVDLYTPHLNLLRDATFGKLKLKQGPHTVRITACEKNPESKGNLVGIDMIRLEPNR